MTVVRSLSATLVLALAMLGCAGTIPAGQPTTTVHALVVYAQASGDGYPWPTKAFRDSLYARLSEFYATMSYGHHKIIFSEVTDNGKYFVAKHRVPYYKEHHDKGRHVRGFGMLNEEILTQVKKKYGTKPFRDVDMIIFVGPDGGPNWYVPRVNATGFAKLGFDFEVGGKVFKKGQGQGGITVEIGSGVGTPSPDDDRLLSLEDIHWTFAHEYAHWLRLGHRRLEHGIFSLMNGNLDKNERMPRLGPPPLDIFHIIDLGWLDESDSTRVLVLNESANVKLNQIRSPEGLVLARIEPARKGEVYYLSYHRRDNNAFDGVLPESGLLLWRKLGRRVGVVLPQRIVSEAAQRATRQGGEVQAAEYVANSSKGGVWQVEFRARAQRGVLNETRGFRISGLRESRTEVSFRIELLRLSEKRN